MHRRAERKSVETGDGARTHGEHIAQYASDPGGGALIGLDVAWMIVAFHLEHDSKPLADIDHPRILARPLNNPGRLRRQLAQMNFRGFVRAVLVPHGRENAELGESRRAADQIADAPVFVRLEAVRGGELRIDASYDRGAFLPFRVDDCGFTLRHACSFRRGLCASWSRRRLLVGTSAFLPHHSRLL